MPIAHYQVVIQSVLLIIFTANLQSSVYSDDMESPLKYVNPFIGTARSPIAANWDGRGGTYPGAVAPFGYIQLSPETGFGHTRGYDYEEDSIHFFSCMGHSSGYPSGSAGRIYIMPMSSDQRQQIGKGRPFSHEEETAGPGYYSVKLMDDNTLVEATATERTGMFRFTFPASVQPNIFIGGIGKVTSSGKNSLNGGMRNTLIEFNSDFEDIIEVGYGNIVRFPTGDQDETIVLLKISTSSTGHTGSKQNIQVENKDWDFEILKGKTQQKWENALSAIEIIDSNITNKTIFYTALYHSMLIPWIVSDTDRSYGGRNGTVYTSKGLNQYGQFSPWDTFRSLHPLLCLLEPGRQNDMILSMLDIYQQSGWLPTMPMTGNHAIPIIVDSWFKGIRDFDHELAYSAMKKNLMGPDYFHADMETYSKLGYLPLTFPESVTKTVEYAYDDWALAKYSKSVMQNESDNLYLLDRSFNYRNLLDPDELFLLPRNEEVFKKSPGSFGYKEGDKWIYTYFVPHNPRDLINLTGGDDVFTARLDSGFTHNNVVFDNEPVFHIPYLFNYTNQPYKTQKWLRHIRSSFLNAPGGLPGNDDLGSMSSWYVFSAMGFYPACPGNPIYTLGAPLFENLTLTLENNKKFVVRAENASPENCYIRKVLLNGQPYNKSWIPHSTIIRGGEILFEMDSVPNYDWASGHSFVPESETSGTPDFQISNITISKKKVLPNEKFWVRFSLNNNGSMGTKNVAIWENGNRLGSKNIVLEKNASRMDSIECRLYNPGKAWLAVNESPKKCKVRVIDNKLEKQFEYRQLSYSPILKLGEMQDVSIEIQNTGGKTDTALINISINDRIVHGDQMVLSPGETKTYNHSFPPSEKGINTIRINNLSEDFKVYSDNVESTFVDLSQTNTIEKGIVSDQSGLSNHGYIRTGNTESDRLSDGLTFGENSYVEIIGKNSHFEISDISMMAWVRPAGGNRRLTALITKGEDHVIQLQGNRSLTFFVGGWGRGQCRAALPENWENNWHHVAGVCEGNHLKVYIDGALKGSTRIGNSALKESQCNWHLGRNEEFPGQRIFKGEIDYAKILVEPLSEEEINSIINSEKNRFQ